MESKTHYTAVGIAVVILLFGLITVGLWLSEGFNRKTYHNYLVYMQEAVSGLSEGSLVKYNGVKVGVISSISLDKNPSLVQLVLQIEEGTPITVDTSASLVAQGITGTTFLGLSVSSNNRTLLTAKPGCLFPVIPYHPSMLLQLETVIQDIGKSIKSLMSKENSDNFKKILDNFQKVSKLFATNDEALQKTLEQMPKLTAELRASIGRFGEMSHDLSVAGKQLNATMVTGKDTLELLSQQAVPPAVSMLHRLDAVAANMEALSAELRRNPSILIRGATPPKKGPGE